MKNSINEKIEIFIEEHSKIIRNLFKDKYDLKEAQKKIILILPYLIAGLTTAIFATFYARVFGLIEKESIVLINTYGNWSLIFVPLLFILSWFIVERYAVNSNGSGIPQLMAAAEISSKDAKNSLINNLLGFKIIIAKFISSLICVLGGGAIGREGPTLQIAASIFKITNRLFPKELYAKNLYGMILAGGAAGLASAFNTPLGGITYVVEELSKSHISSFRTGILYAVIIAGLMSQLIIGPYLYLGFPNFDNFQLNQLGMLCLISAIIGILVAFFGQILKLVVIYRARLDTKIKRMLAAALSGIIFILLVKYISTTAMGSGKELITELLFKNHTSNLLEVFSRFGGTVITYASGGAGGIFAPTLSLGGVTASYIESFFSVKMGALGILIGMTAALSALTHSPLTSFVLILEMTDKHSAIFPLMLAAIIGHSFSKLISKKTFYEFVCERILATKPESL